MMDALVIGDAQDVEDAVKVIRRQARYDALIEASCIADKFDFDGGIAQKIADAIRDRAGEVREGTADPSVERPYILEGGF